MDRGAWRATVHGVGKSQTRLSDYHSLTIGKKKRETLVKYSDSPWQIASSVNFYFLTIYMGPCWILELSWCVWRKCLIMLTLKSSLDFLGLGFLTLLGVSDAPQGAWGSVHSDGHRSGCVFSCLAVILPETSTTENVGRQTSAWSLGFGFDHPPPAPMRLGEPASHCFSPKELLVSSSFLKSTRDQIHL